MNRIFKKYKAPSRISLQTMIEKLKLILRSKRKKKLLRMQLISSMKMFSPMRNPNLEFLIIRLRANLRGADQEARKRKKSHQKH